MGGREGTGESREVWLSVKLESVHGVERWTGEKGQVIPVKCRVRVLGREMGGREGTGDTREVWLSVRIESVYGVERCTAFGIPCNCSSSVTPDRIDLLAPRRLEPTPNVGKRAWDRTDFSANLCNASPPPNRALNSIVD
ncbi:hypothetical protein PoB_007544400 [Plakobranchus ocellatus]|uniref:Uncharacterized protein n=1 Tax=Plakobranchus ocellatus TaxID=259542 RepID=A0AAV4DXK3_9GAST|nr:hypothetical protein PoB_007544400 [Plakobranchus ocellatus]